MDARQLLSDGRLEAAIDRLSAELKDRPDDAARRTFLFELLGFAGRWDRAGKHLDVLAASADTPQATIGAGLLRRLLDAEQQRERLFSEGLRPRFALEPTEAVLLHLEAVEALRQGRPDEARDALDRAEAARRPTPGRSAAGPFDDLRDADDLLAPALEVFAPAGYCWVPWEHVQFLEVGPPGRLRDLLWLPARLATFDGQLGEVHLPNLYPGSASHADEAVRLGRRTEWEEVGAGIVRGRGQKVLLAGEEARTLAELAELHLDRPPEPDGAGPAP
jgi:type VI secretion system protein ImpE